MTTDRTSIIRRIADEVDGGWTSTAQVQFTLAPDDPESRRTIRQVVGDLVRANQIEHLWCVHRDSPLLILFIDRHELLALTESSERTIHGVA